MKHRITVIANKIFDTFLDVMLENVLEGNMVALPRNRKAYIGKMQYEYPKELQSNEDKLFYMKTPSYGLKFTNFNMGLYNFKISKKHRATLRENIKNGQVYYD